VYAYEVKVLHVNLRGQITICRLVDARVIHILSAFNRSSIKGLKNFEADVQTLGVSDLGHTLTRGLS
jgi:hypothetical protein